LRRKTSGEIGGIRQRRQRETANFDHCEERRYLLKNHKKVRRRRVLLARNRSREKRHKRGRYREKLAFLERKRVTKSNDERKKVSAIVESKGQAVAEL